MAATAADATSAVIADAVGTADGEGALALATRGAVGMDGAADPVAATDGSPVGTTTGAVSAVGRSLAGAAASAVCKGVASLGADRA